LHCFTDIMNAEFYTGILRERIPEVKAMLGDEFRWQQDNDPKHTSRRAMTFLKNNVSEVIDWPSCSPDLNPIENIWAIVKRNVEYRMPNNLEELRRYMIEEWQAIPKSFLKNLIDSMQGRCREVLEKNGELIAY
jgi:DDE superfamily endonuclease